MRYHFEKPEFYASQYGQIYICEHPVYSRCTLYRIEKKKAWQSFSSALTRSRKRPGGAR